jgi:hypothetical protein
MAVFEKTFERIHGTFLPATNRALAICSQKLGYGEFEKERFSNMSDDETLWEEAQERFGYEGPKPMYINKWWTEGKYELWEVRYIAHKTNSLLDRLGIPTQNHLQRLYVVIHDDLAAVKYGLLEAVWTQ